MRVVLVTQAVAGGGAFRACARLHDALRAAEVDSVVAAGDVTPGLLDMRLVGRTRREFRYARLEVQYARVYAEALLMKFQRTGNPLLHSPAIIPGAGFSGLGALEPDVLNLHWVTGGFLSVKQIGRLLDSYPTVWTLHDQWAFMGAEHYQFDETDSRWRSGYRRANRPKGVRGLDLNAVTWRRKQRFWGTPAELVVPSNWLARCASESALLSEWPVTVIPNPLDFRTFRPIGTAYARELLSLPLDVPLLLFAANGGPGNQAKGWGLLEAALPAIHAALPELEIIVVGNRIAGRSQLHGVNIHSLGILKDEISMVLAYGASTAVAVPSVVDNLPRTGTEAQACGRPVIGFRIGGLPDIVEHGITGYLANPFDTDELAHGVVLCVEQALSEPSMVRAVRSRAKELWSPEIVANRYVAIYRKALARQ